MPGKRAQKLCKYCKRRMLEVSLGSKIPVMPFRKVGPAMLCEYCDKVTPHG